MENILGNGTTIKIYSITEILRMHARAVIGWYLLSDLLEDRRPNNVTAWRDQSSFILACKDFQNS